MVDILYTNSTNSIRSGNLQKRNDEMILYVLASGTLILLAIANFFLFEVLRGSSAFSDRTRFVMKFLAPLGTIVLSAAALVVIWFAKRGT